MLLSYISAWCISSGQESSKDKVKNKKLRDLLNKSHVTWQAAVRTHSVLTSFKLFHLNSDLLNAFPSLLLLQHLFSIKHAEPVRKTQIFSEKKGHFLSCAKISSRESQPQ